jgi:hypothetical protein
MHKYQDAIRNFVTEMLHDSPAAQRILALWMVRDIIGYFYVVSCYHEQEYEEQVTPEARFVKGRRNLITNKDSLTRYADLDRIEMALQGRCMISYDRNRNII